MKMCALTTDQLEVDTLQVFLVLVPLLLLLIFDYETLGLDIKYSHLDLGLCPKLVCQG